MSVHNYEQCFPILEQVALTPLRTAAVLDGRAVFPVGDDFLFSDDGPARLQPYPGETLPDLTGRELFPHPEKVGEYVPREDFEKIPKYMAQWVHWPERVRCVLEGRYFDLKPAHFEGIFTLVCNFMCPHCSRRVTRTHWVEGGAWDNNTEVEQRNTMFPNALRRVLDQVASFRTDSQMGIVWGGGDPTANPFTYDAMLYARSLGISGSFLTNGVFLEVDRVLDANPILVRISLNCGSEESYRRFHGYPKGWDYFPRALGKIRELMRRKLDRKARTLIGISLIVDERNIEDLTAAAEQIRDAVDDIGPGIDYVIIRPVFNYAHFDRNYAFLECDTKKRSNELISEGGPVWRILRGCGVPLIPVKDSFEAPPADAFYTDPRCLAYGMCGEIRHNGDVQLCSDSYGNPEYTIGNLLDQNLDEIWSSPRRQAVLERINARECFRNVCPHNSRGHHHNRVFHQIEKHRNLGQLEQVRRWIDDLRETTIPLGHSFFI